MTILAIDTSEAYCSAALVRGGNVLASRCDNIGRGHAEHLLPMIEGLLETAGTGYPDISRVAVTCGPGTFTGLRIGLSVARGLALGLGVPCLGLSGLTVLAAAAEGDGPVHAVMTGRGGQAYHQAFEGRSEDGLPMPISEPASLPVDEILRRITATPGRIVGSGSPSVMPGAVPTGGIDPEVLASLAETLAPESFPPDPLYLRAADAAKAKPLLPVAP
ncbi:tRNA (adenosine(37)-N6)-threonylcarbamoyltransferase complex dimerization subunit type 1 TsaB [Kordiimonas marina]|uniref:tRNA (adenosine(37)-N6)-threonylcarbamoyltransferase complex dimerization subunit type 1 TsaB n=1 Tax=Kordiimonas marina TaxID=2872312 RepID=UPI001FF0E155|nr:tRNA (adenosine(37)-N6)-threonylcarbamoyltransferase complex dimerization subunit type 1 TsaB [Kordiimonas marina]MCJ9428247.1 tRNA (adenosine(37)-N6)-threonylcarbamoyltransferase complex dimerization subunit type 1 TsaB [Kordiimonas marina]